VEIPINNYQDIKTYYGALNLLEPIGDKLTLFCQFRQKIIWDGYIIRLLPKTLISTILLENKCSNP
jgi:hypothetical protein